MKAVGYIACMVGGATLWHLLMVLGVVDVLDGVPGSLEEPVLSLPTYLSFISAMMTAVTAVLAVLAIGIGVVAFFTFRGLKDAAQKIASQTVDRMVNEKLSDEAIKSRIDEIALRQGPKSELEEGFDPDDTSER